MSHETPAIQADVSMGLVQASAGAVGFAVWAGFGTSLTVSVGVWLALAAAGWLFITMRDRLPARVAEGPKADPKEAETAACKAAIDAHMADRERIKEIGSELYMHNSSVESFEIIRLASLEEREHDLREVERKALAAFARFKVEADPLGERSNEQLRAGFIRHLPRVSEQLPNLGLLWESADPRVLAILGNDRVALPPRVALFYDAHDLARDLLSWWQIKELEAERAELQARKVPFDVEIGAIRRDKYRAKCYGVNGEYLGPPIGEAAPL